MHVVWRAKGKANGCSKAPEQQGAKGERNGTWGHDDPDYFPHRCHNRRENCHKAMHDGKPKGKGRGKKGVYGVDDEATEENESRDFGDTDARTADSVVEVGVGQPSARIHDDLSRPHQPGVLRPLAHVRGSQLRTEPTARPNGEGNSGHAP